MGVLGEETAGGRLEGGETGRWVRAGGAGRGIEVLSGEGEMRRAKSGLPFRERAGAPKARRPVPKGDVQGRWQGIQGLPLKLAVSQASGLTATGQSPPLLSRRPPLVLEKGPRLNARVTVSSHCINNRIFVSDTCILPG